MTCPIAVEDVFGPVVAATCHDGFDFTLLFEETVLCMLPAVVFAVVAPFRLWQLLHRPPVSRPGHLYYVKLATHAAFIAVDLAQLVILSVPGLVPKTRASIPSAAVILYVTLVSLALSRLEHLRSVRPSTLLSLYLGLTLLFDLVRARTLWTIQHNRPVAAVFTVGLVFKLVSFIAESVEKSRRKAAAFDSRPRETAGSVFTRGLFCWLNPLLWQGFRRVLSVESLPAIDSELGTPEFQRQLWARWLSLPHKTAGALVKLVIVTHQKSIIQGVLPRLALSGFTFAQPFLITRVVIFATSPDSADGKLDKQIGNGLILATAIIYIGLAVSNANAQHKAYRVITKLRASLISLIYRKLLGSSIPASQESSAITLISADVERSGTGLRFMHEVWASLIDLGLGFYLLQRELGPASAAPGVFFLLCSGAGLKVAASMGQRQRLWLEAIDHRIKATSDTLSSMKEVRMGGLQTRTQAQLEGLRKKEIMASRPFKNALALIVCLSYTTAAMGPVFSFGIYSLLAKKNNTMPITADKGFTALSVFSLLRTPMAMLLDALGGLVGSLGAMQRVGDFLSTESSIRSWSEEQIWSNPPPPYELRGLEKSYNPYEPAIPLTKIQTPATAPSLSLDPRIVNAPQYSAGWDEDRGFILQDLKFSVSRGSLTFIVGPVGSGKSTLLHAILGETTVNQGELHTSFDHAAFVGQSSWLISDTIQNNIIGTGRLEKAWYDQVIDACALRDDISRMPLGDQEMVDGGGSNLSGGQQARLGIARAVYSRQRVVLFDDVMSGLDARTEQTVFNNLLGPRGLLRGGGRTTIFATNAIHRLPAGDHIIVLSADGKILEQGPYGQLHSITKHALATTPDSEGQGEVVSNQYSIAMRDIASQLSPETISGSQRRTGDLTVYKYYIGGVGWFNFALFMFCGALFVFALIFPQYVMTWWTQENARRPHGKLGLYLGSYAALAVLAICGLAAGCLTLVRRMMPRASSFFHSKLLQTTLNAPLSLFAGSSVGETVNRFSQDLQLIDMELPLALFNTTVELLSSVGNLLVIAIAAKYLGAALPLVLVVFLVVQVFYLRTARQLRLLDIEAKAPLVSHFLETSSGLAEIRAYGAEADYEQRCMDKLDYSQKPFYLLYCAQRWLNLVLDLIVAAIAIVFITIAVKAKGEIDPSLVGTALVGIVNFSVSIKGLLENWTNLEMCIGAVSRVRAFDLSAKSEHKPGEDQLPQPNWPAQGHLVYQGVTASWEGKDSPAIKDLTLDVQPGQKLAICGRSGSGKSSLVSALFRLLEPEAGFIMVDGVDIATVPRQKVRESLICVPQVPFLLTGTVRENVDPFCVANDETIWDAIRQVQMFEVVQNLGGLDIIIDGDSMSVGQKQLLCLARAVLRPGSILVLDEATASLDYDTDAVVKDVINSAFRNHTIIAIAHRLWSIVDYDRVAVIADGRVAEYGKPSDLLDDPDSIFGQLYRISATHEAEELEEKSQEVKQREEEAAWITSLFDTDDQTWLLK